ncbi:MAG: serpin family protein, partial [Chloroflexota bacterium]
MKRLPIMIPALAITAVISAACGSGDPAGTPDPTATPQPSPAPTQAPVATPTPGIVQEVAYSDRERVASPEVPDADARELSEGNTAFALDLYQQLREEDGNLFYSPASISLALAMTYAGARGETE